VIFDRYLDQSLKAITRQKRASTSTEFAVYPEMKLCRLKNFFPHQKPSTIILTCMFAEGLLEHFVSGKMNIKLVVTFYNKIKNHDFEETH